MKKIFKGIILLVLAVIFFQNYSMSAIYSNGSLTFDSISFDTYIKYDKSINIIIAMSNKQRMEYYKLIAKWDSSDISDAERYKDIEKFINETSKLFEGLIENETNVGKKLYNKKEKYLEELKVYLKEYRNFYNEDIIFINYMLNDKDLNEWYTLYQKFKDVTLEPLLNKYLFTNNMRVNLLRLDDENKEERDIGVNNVKSIIKELNIIKKDKKTSNLIKEFCRELIDYYTSLINDRKQDFSIFIMGDKIRVEGLIAIGQAYDEILEYNHIRSMTSNFVNFPSVELSKKIKTSKLNDIINELQKTMATTKNTIEIKKRYYDLVYSVVNYKLKKDFGKTVKEAYYDFYQYINYINVYYSHIQNQYGYDITSDKVKEEISIYKSKVKCFTTNDTDEHLNIQYMPIIERDTTEYRQLSLNQKFEWHKLVIPLCLTTLIIGIILFVLKAIRNKNDNYSDGYDDYY